jgi:transposase
LVLIDGGARSVDVSTRRMMGTISGRRPRKRWPEALKREVVAATLVPGASVSVVARRYDVNANQVFSWRPRYCEDIGQPLSPSAPQLVPVTITTEPDIPAPAPPLVAETIESVVSDTYCVRVGAGFDDHALGRILDVLRRANGTLGSHAAGEDPWSSCESSFSDCGHSLEATLRSRR